MLSPLPPVPLVVAPMAGGPSTPELVAAACGAGATGMLAGGYLTPEALGVQVREAAELTDRPFGVNLFMPSPPPTMAEREAVDRYAERLLPWADRLGVRPGAPFEGVAAGVTTALDRDHVDAKLDLLLGADGGAGLAAGVPQLRWISFTFGCPPPHWVERARRAGLQVLVTVTCLDEAMAARHVGADALVVQGSEAGGHRGTHDPLATPDALDTLGLVDMLGDLGLPLVAAGGISTAGDMRRALDAGATLCQAGTAFLLAPEAGTNAGHRAGLTDPSLTASVVTRAFSGRWARGIRNGFVDAHDEGAPPVYPSVHHVTAPLRRAAAAQGDAHGVSLWAGTGWRSVVARPAAETVRALTP